ncbi:putative Zn finger-like uncharacterized protein [Palleronia aestuarii]|uniref:Putative Zn finger-like uncharacterized protein n=1 Tax=Palleronia aestuarii TaxID=568105 RepID=A0A2W7P2C3_9RHOB|nr:zinc-ribbon domain-containing protein [Palleronia aestuarii]PZX19576.1 putative Zn finger-like uncharacterized protein [Palleronia aestuarii]
MRLTCPECGAMYELDASLIPQHGREVQCSACEARWHAHPDRSAATMDTDPDEDGEEEAAPPAPAPRRRDSDVRAREILREEAARESAARRAAGIPPPPPNSWPLDMSDSDNGTPTRPDASPVQEAPAAGRGFGLGFGLMVSLALLLAVAYILAAPITQAVPAIAEPVDGYVEAVDGLRRAVNGWVASGSEALRNLLGGANGTA